MTSKKLQDRIYAVRGNQIYYCKFGEPTNPFSNVTWQKKIMALLMCVPFFREIKVQTIRAIQACRL